MADVSLTTFITSLSIVTITIVFYQIFYKIQKQLMMAWLNPMLLSIAALVPFIIYIDMSFEEYFLAAQPINKLLEFAVVTLGFPLYQHLKTIRHQWRPILAILFFGVLLVTSVSLMITMMIISLPKIAVSLSLKSITTPIAIAITQKLQGDSSITAFSVILAGLFGAFLGPRWLALINVHSPQAQGLAIGAASHALGTATISKLSYEHAAYGSLALIFSAVITAVVSPILLPLLLLCWP